VLLAAGSGAGYVTWNAAHKPRHPVPNLVADTPAQAQQALAGLHLQLHVTQAYNDHVLKGLIVSQVQPPRSLVHEGTSVAVVESLGPPPETVPDLTGLSLNDATNRLIGAQFTLGVVSRRFDNTPKDTVLSWSGQGGQLPKGSPVDLVVSNGPPVVTVPKLPAGSTFAAAQAALAPLPLTAIESDAFSTAIPKGQVISTSPAAGASVQVGTKVTVTVSKGPDLVAVTNVAGSSVNAATQALQAAGFNVSGVTGNPTRIVTHTSPAAGTQVLRGSSVTLFTT
jgi:serine/threonine-protein kinase